MANATLVNFAGGETSPKSRGRFDIASYNSSCRKLVNFIAEVSGPARFRPGFKTLAPTCGHQEARLIPFQYTAARSFMLEFTSGRMRVFENGELQRGAPKTAIQSWSNITSDSLIQVASITGISEGSIVRLIDSPEVPEFNNLEFRASSVSGSSFNLHSLVTGNAVPISYRAITELGYIQVIYHIASPYLTEDLEDIQYVQTVGALYLLHWRYAPRKLTFNEATGVWTLATITRTSDPFVVGGVLNLTGVNLAVKGSVILDNPAVEDQVYTFAGITGTTQLNGGVYRLQQAYTIVYGVGDFPGVPGARKEYISGTYWLVNTTTGAYVDTTAWTAWSSGGTATPDIDCAISGTFYETRFAYAGTTQRPRTLFLSRSSSSTGASRFDDFTGGTDADHACFFSLAPVNGTSDYIRWAAGSSKYLLCGTFGGVFRISGGGLDEPITPSSINSRQVDAYGCATVPPVMNGNALYFIQRDQKAVRVLGYSSDSDDITSFDLCLNAEHIGDSALKRLAFQPGASDILWVVREDGQLVGLTVSGAERVSGWHRHKLGGTDAKVIEAAVYPRAASSNQLYIVAERTMSSTVNGTVSRLVEVLTDDVIYPDPEDFYTAESAQAANEEDYMDAVYRLQERYIHIDAASTYNGSDAGVAAGATLTPSAVTVGTGRTFTASTSVFTAADVGKEIWKKPSAVDGTGSGRATITAYTSATEVTAEITAAFDSATAIPAGDWYLAADEISGLSYLEGERVAVVADGAVYSDGKTADYPTVTVTNGAIALSRNCAVVHVGLPYEGMLITHNLEMGGSTGPAQDKPRNIARMAIRFLNSLGCEFGTSLYRTEKVVHNSNKYVSDRPTPVFSGVKIVHNSDTWKPDSGDKNVVVVQKLPLPCVVQFIDVHYETGDEA